MTIESGIKGLRRNQED